jgi:uncharacterized membrane protein YgcG
MVSEMLSVRAVRVLLFLFALLFVWLLPAAPAEAQFRSFYWERFDVEMTLLENGDMRVVENQVLHFSGAPFSAGFGTIYTGRQGNNDGITDITVREGDIEYRRSASEQPHTFNVSRESGQVVVEWFFPPASGRRHYTFTYTVEGAVRVDQQGDQIFWKAIPADHAGSIHSSTVIVNLPEGVRPQVDTRTGEPLVTAYVNGQEGHNVTSSVSPDGRRVTFQTTAGIPANQMLEVRVQFPHGILNISTPNWQRMEQIADTLSLIVLALSIMVLIGGPLLVLLLWYLFGRDPVVGPVADYLPEPPSDLPPALVGTLIDERADMHDIISTLVDLARRGYLTMTEEARDHLFARTSKGEGDLRPYEKLFLNGIFRGAESRRLSALRYNFADRLPGIRNALYRELVQENLMPSSPDTIRNRYQGGAILLFVVAVVSFCGLTAFSDGLISTGICLGMALAVTAVILLVTGRHMPRKTPKGAEEAARWLAFKRYLQNVEKHTNLEEATAIFDRYLAYAIAFGMERSWLQKFARVSEAPVPPWYQPLPRRPGGKRPVSGGPVLTAPVAGMPAAGGAAAAGSRPGGLEGMSRGVTGGLESMSTGLTRMLTSSTNILQSTRPAPSSGGSSSGSRGFSGGGSFSSGGGGSRGFR